MIRNAFHYEWVTRHTYSSQSQVKSKIFIANKNEYHTYNNIRDWNPFGFICLLKYKHYSYRTWPHFGDNKVSTGASTEAKRSTKGTGWPPQPALESFHAENLQYSLWQQGRPHDDIHAAVHNNDAKHLGVKIPQSIHNTGKICHMFFSAVFMAIAAYMWFLPIIAR